jgi:hypothetical protein
MLSFRCVNLTATRIQVHSVLRTILVILISSYSLIHSVSFSVVVARTTRKLSHDLRAVRYRECMKRGTAYFNSELISPVINKGRVIYCSLSTLYTVLHSTVLAISPFRFHIFLIPARTFSVSTQFVLYNLQYQLYCTICSISPNMTIF